MKVRILQSIVLASKEYRDKHREDKLNLDNGPRMSRVMRHVLLNAWPQRAAAITVPVTGAHSNARGGHTGLP